MSQTTDVDELELFSFNIWSHCPIMKFDAAPIQSLMSFSQFPSFLTSFHFYWHITCTTSWSATVSALDFTQLISIHLHYQAFLGGWLFTSTSLSVSSNESSTNGGSCMQSLQSVLPYNCLQSATTCVYVWAGWTAKRTIRSLASLTALQQTRPKSVPLLSYTHW